MFTDVSRSRYEEYPEVVRRENVYGGILCSLSYYVSSFHCVLTEFIYICRLTQLTRIMYILMFIVFRPIYVAVVRVVTKSKKMDLNTGLFKMIVGV